jgi:hypothetical protein
MTELTTLWRHLTVEQRRAITELARCFAGRKGESGRIAVTFSKGTRGTT